MRSPHEATAEASRPALSKGRAMSSINAISAEKLARLIGTPKCPALVDVRTDETSPPDPRLIPGSIRRPATDPSGWTAEFAGRPAIVICQKGLKLSACATAWLRYANIP